MMNFIFLFFNCNECSSMKRQNNYNKVVTLATIRQFLMLSLQRGLGRPILFKALKKKKGWGGSILFIYMY